MYCVARIWYCVDSLACFEHLVVVTVVVVVVVIVVAVVALPSRRFIADFALQSLLSEHKFI